MISSTSPSLTLISGQPTLSSQTDCFITGHHRPRPQDFADECMKQQLLKEAYSAPSGIEKVFFIIKAHISGSLSQRQTTLRNEVAAYLLEKVGINVLSEHFDPVPVLVDSRQERGWSKTAILLFGVDLLSQQQTEQLLKQRYPQHTGFSHSLTFLSHSCCKIAYSCPEQASAMIRQFRAGTSEESETQRVQIIGEQWFQLKPYEVLGISRNLFARRALRQQNFPRLEGDRKFHLFNSSIQGLANYLLVKYKASESFRRVSDELRFTQHTASLLGQPNKYSLISSFKLKGKEIQIAAFAPSPSPRDSTAVIEVVDGQPSAPPNQEEEIHSSFGVGPSSNSLPIVPLRPGASPSRITEERLEVLPQAGCQTDVRTPPPDEIGRLFKACQQRKTMKRAHREFMDISDEDSSHLPGEKRVDNRKRKLIAKKGYLPFRDEHAPLEVSCIISNSDPSRQSEPGSCRQNVPGSCRSNEFQHSSGSQPIEFLDFTLPQKKSQLQRCISPMASHVGAASAGRVGVFDSSEAIDLVSELSQEEDAPDRHVANELQLERQRKVWNWYRGGLTSVDFSILECGIRSGLRDSS